MWMPAPNRALLVLACAGALWLGMAASLKAQAPADLTEYDEVLKQAVEAHREQRWQEAHALFEKAHALYPNARTLRGLGISAFEAGQHALALRDLEAALLHEERPLSPELRGSVEALVAHLRGLVGAYVFRLEPEGAELRIDDAEPIISPRGEVLLDPGRHRAVVSLAGHVTQTIELDAHGGDRSEIRVLLVPTPVIAPVTAEPSPERALPPPPLEAPVDGWSWQRSSAVVSGGTGILAFVTAGALYGVAEGRVRDIGDICGKRKGGGCTLDERQNLKETHNLLRLENAVNATIAVGTVLVAASAVLWVLDWRARKKPSQHSALPLGITF
jgi:hypothetical protein